MSTKADGQVVIEIDADGNKAGKELEKTADVLERVSDAAESTADSLAIVSKDLAKTEESAKNLGAELDGVGDSAEESSHDIGGFRDRLEEAEDAEAKLAAGASVLAASLIAIGAQAVQAASEFDSAFAKTQTIMDQNVMSARQMREEILSLSDDSGMKADAVSEAVYQAISGSVATKDAVAFVDQANKLAVSGFTSLSNATDVLTTTLNAYGLEADKVSGISNVLIQTQNLGKTSVDELSASMGKAISTGSAYGVNLENLSAAYVELTRGGIPTAEATTYVSAMLNELGDSGSTVGGILREQTGKSFGQLMADGASLGDVLQILSGTVDGNAEALMGLWSSQEAGKASNAIMTQGIEDFNEVLAQMEREMFGATGTTDKAYETMTNTSEFIDLKFKNSINNLGIAFGDNLSPALDGAKSLLTGLVEGATTLVENNPGITAVLTGATVGIGALAVVMATYTLKAKLATTETWKLTTAMLSNPVVLLVTGITALVVGIGVYAAQSAAATEETEKLSAASEQQRLELQNLEAEYKAVCEAQGETSAEAQLLKKELDEQRETFEKNKQTAQELEDQLKNTHDAYVEMTDQYNKRVEGIEDEYESTLNLIERLNELTEAEHQSAAAKQEILAIVDILNERIPELGLNYDALTGKLTMTPDEVIAAATNAYNQEKTQADWDALRNAIAANEDSADGIGFETAMNNAKADYDAKKAQYETAKRAYEAKGKEVLGDKPYATTQAEATALRSYALEVDAAIEAMNTAEGKMKAAEKDYYDNQAEIERLSNVLGEVEEKSQSAALSFEGAAETWNNAASVLSEAYNEAYTAARESIDGQIGLFENMGTVAAASASSMIKSLDSQIAYLDQYATNMQLAAERGINQGLLQKLSDGSKESAEILAGLVNATDEQIEQINEKFAKVGEGKDQFAEAMTEYTGVVEDEKQAMVDLAAQVGLDMSDALTRGLLDGYDAYRAAWRSYQNLSQPHKDAPQYSAYASGTYSANAGLALVGEAGPELVYLRGGERILTAEETRAALRTVWPSAPNMGTLGIGAPAIAGRGTVQLRATIAVPVAIDGREFARVTAQYMGEEMEWGVM